MPRYDFRCIECAEQREVLVPFDQADSLELVCVDCGGDMIRAMTKSFAIVTGTAQRATPSPTGTGQRKGPTCSDGAVKLTRPNPFSGALPSMTDHQEG
ncbi:MAG TPA: zinc ribbon domain-containing protein [Pseudonocardiaceae bacterium]|jgi:putative FmdB family regulatory protein